VNENTIPVKKANIKSGSLKDSCILRFNSRILEKRKYMSIKDTVVSSSGFFVIFTNTGRNKILYKINRACMPIYKHCQQLQEKFNMYVDSRIIIF